ncbi:hypothetical protein HUU62_17130 [Rhodoferax sp. 4810]|uniref:Uncharacterized protein n=1 Tax=Thiospirillum jenense TaxID=1653858 RepID=A0A839HJB2_9GAMM|nr:hypothetical protein [Thiospirillum jenense]MBB1076132.1 hypothetical protein [Rhodoferax jenense]MBB1126082.1 hypothetical protein [Thiospirillum jenense]
MSATFTDDNYTKINYYGGERDAAIWTGAYLAAESFRYLATGAPDALIQVNETARVLHRWWTLPGDPGYLARYAAPSSSPPEIKAALSDNDSEVVHKTLQDGIFWDWRGNVSRDQYQGVLLGMALAYEATNDLAVRELIRADIVTFAEQLMRHESRQVNLVIDGETHVINLELENVVYSTIAMPSGIPTLTIDTRSGDGDVNGAGILVFWPNPSEYLRQLPDLGWMPDILLATQALQLGAAFSLALHVTNDVPEYAARRSAINNYYTAHVDTWLDIAKRWSDTSPCGDAYHGLNISFTPAFIWLRTETDATRHHYLRDKVLIERLWPAVQSDNNVWFAFIYASQAPEVSENNNVVTNHVNQLAGFPSAPNRAVAVDVSDEYWENPFCSDLALSAIDVSERVPATFIWERQPWKREDPGVPYRLYGGVDYLLAYWMGRYYGYIDDDAPNTCLNWHTAPATGIEPAGMIEIPQPNSYQTGIGLVSGWQCAAGRLEMSIDGGRAIPVAYGSERADTQAHCGDANNGFSFPINYNSLADGEHHIALLADGEPVTTVNFQVRTLGAEFQSGLSGQFSLADFPTVGQTTALQWQEASQRFVITPPDAPAINPAPLVTTGALEVPAVNAQQSGVGIIAGWYCDAINLTVSIDGGRALTIPYGTERADTLTNCGDMNNGFGFLINYSGLGDGEHRIDLTADGIPVANTTFSVHTLGQEFMTGLVGNFALNDFPNVGLTTQVMWQEANQGFVMNGVTPMQ